MEQADLKCPQQKAFATVSTFSILIAIGSVYWTEITENDSIQVGSSTSSTSPGEHTPDQGWVFKGPIIIYRIQCEGSGNW